MNRYPKLSLNQQHNLPTLIKATRWPSMYEDSTHQLWHCDTVDGEFMLKVCNSNNVLSSTFWQGMSHLFDVQLPTQLGHFKTVYNVVEQQGTLLIPDYIASSSNSINNTEEAFILTEIMSGSMIFSNKVDDAMVEALAKHISQLHSEKYILWGKAIQPEFVLSDWSKRLQMTLQILAEKQAIPSTLLTRALTQAQTISPSVAVLTMPDIRWDQFLQNEGKLTTLVDLDAFVYAPRELELVLLEILLNESQAAIFVNVYRQQHSLPDLSNVRMAYRLLLFLMNVLGETDIDAWLKNTCRFDI